MNRVKHLFQYILPTFRMDLLWLPAGLWLLFAVVVAIMGKESNNYYVARSFLGGALPLTGGILAAYAVLDDPALELQFATPRPGWSMLLERLGTILVVLAVSALTYQGFLAIVGIELQALGEGFLLGQLAWMVPSLAMIALGSAAGFALGQSAGGALIAGGVWFLQVILNGVIGAHPVGRYVYLFMGVGSSPPPELRANQACLLAIAGLLLWTCVRMIKNQERYI